jgi:IS5 family transposase
MSQLSQTSLLTFVQEQFGITRTESFLDKIQQVVPWDTLVARIQWSRKIADGGVGRPRTETIRLIKILFLQGLYGLSDPEVEDQIKDRKSFQKFVTVSEASDIPDETTICRFRNELVRAGMQESIFTITQCMLTEMGFSVKKGSIQDGTIIEAPKGKKRTSWPQAGTSTRDTEAWFTQKNGRTYHGYKGHIETSETGNFVMNTVFSSATVHDSQAQDALMLWEETCLYWDSAYGMSQNKNEWYNELGIETELHEKGKRGSLLTSFQKEQNRIKSSVRARVEHPFATLKTRYGNYRVRYRWMRKNAMHWFLACALFNFEMLARKYAS